MFRIQPHLAAFAAACFLLVGSSAAHAQQPYTLHAVIPGQPAVTAGSLTLTDNGTPVPIQSVQRDTAPGSLILVLDAVNAPYTQIANEREQLRHFLAGALPLPTSIVIAGDTSLEATPGYTTDGDALNTALQQKTVALRDIRRSAGFYGATERLDLSLGALDRVLAYAATRPGRKTILWISPGWPLLSGPGVELTGKEEQSIYDQVVRISSTVHRAGVTLYSVNPLGAGEDVLREHYYEQFLKSPTKPSHAQLGNLGIQVLALQSGGLTLDSNNDISAMVRTCVADSTAGYTLTFTPAPVEPGNDYHRLALRSSAPGPQPRTQQGFYTTR